MPDRNGSSEKQLDSAIQSIDRRAKERRERVEAALQKHMPDFPVDLLRATFGARIESVRSPEINYGPEIERGIVPTDPWVIPKPPKGDYPAVVVEMSPEKRRFLRRLRRVRTAGKMRHHEHQYE